MSPLDAAAAAVGAWLVTTGWQASVLIVLILAAQKLAGDSLAPRFRHALWLLVVLRLALPDLPAFPTSLFGLLPKTLALPPRAHAIVLLLVGVWLVVALFLAARIAWRAHRLTARVGPKRPVTRPDVIDLLEDCKQELGVMVRTNASFEKKSAASETITLQLAPDGRWRVVGYFIQ